MASFLRRHARMPLPHPPEVLHCVLSVATGGLETMVLQLASATDRSRYTPRVVCLHETGELAPRFLAAGVPVDLIDRPRSGGRGTLTSLLRYLRAHRPPVLHTHNRGAHQHGAFATRLLGIPAHLHTRHNRSSATTWRTRLLERTATRWTDAIVAVSADAAEVARTVDLARPDQLHLIPNGVDLVHFHPKAGLSPGHRVVHVARLDPVKDQAMLLQAAHLVAAVEPRFHLDIIGDGPSRTSLEQLTATLNLTHCVTFHGMQSDVTSWLRTADLFVLSSRSEGLPMTLLEAMASGLPIVATNVGGIPEAVTSGETGLLVPPANPRALADAILTLFQHPDQRAAMGTAARARAIADYSLDTMTARYMALYDSLLGARSRKRAA